MLAEFKKFALKGNVVDMAVGIIIGSAFGTIVKSMVADVIMPPVGLVLGGVDFANIFTVIKAGAEGATNFASLAEAKEEAAAPPPPDSKACDFCCSSISIKATRCPNCTSELKAA